MSITEHLTELSKKLRKRPFTFGLHIITRNEAHQLPRILEYAHLFDQVVVVDTGSTDGTYELIKSKYPSVEVHKFEWVEDFSAARNFALSKLTTDIFMWLDSDDVFDEATFEGWLTIAQSIFEKPGLAHAVLPYYYWVDENNEPILKQFRERILKDPTKWEWREPIHEICCTKEDAHSEMVCFDLYPVLHKPIRVGQHNPFRNWKILHAGKTRGLKDIRTMYYIIREATDRGQWEYAVSLGEETVLRKDCDGYFSYDIHKYLGDCYCKLRERDQLEDYFIKAEQHYRQAIDIDPVRNEARDSLVHLYLREEKVFNALQEAEALTEEAPQSVATLSMDKYGSYKFALLAYIHLKYMNLIHSAVMYHLRSIDYPSVSGMALENDKAITAYMQNNNTGIVYCDVELIQQAGWFKKHLIEYGVFDDVVISTDPLCLSLTKHWHFHLTNNIRTCFLEDPDPHVIKFYVSDNEELPVGWYDCYTLPKQESDVEFILDDLINPVEIKHCETIEDAIDWCKRTIHPTQLLIFGKNKSIGEEFARTVADNSVSKTPRLVLDKDFKLVALIGNQKVLSQFLARENVLYVDSPKDIQFFELTKFNITGLKGINYDIVQTTRLAGKVAFFAGGPEPWDGTIHHKIGIGASETSLIFIAEELVKNNFEVAVYSGVPKPIKVSGVQYLPHQFVENLPKDLDLLVVSRYPALIKERRFAKRQVLWLHDLPQVYQDLTPEHVVDKFICVSEWHKAAFLEHFPNIPEWRVSYINNGIYPNKRKKKDRVDNRIVWLSSPDRGAMNFVQLISELRNSNVNVDPWLFYGFHNMKLFYPNDPNIFRSMCRTKFYLRSVGCNLGGRVPLYSVKDFLQTCDAMPYTSSFGETFCVSVLEAAHAGCKLFVNQNGATYETLKKALDKNVEEVVSLPTGKSEYDILDTDKWVKAIKSFKGGNRTAKINKELTWSEIVKSSWIPLIKGELV